MDMERLDDDSKEFDARGSTARRKGVPECSMASPSHLVLALSNSVEAINATRHHDGNEGRLALPFRAMLRSTFVFQDGVC